MSEEEFVPHNRPMRAFIIYFDTTGEGMFVYRPTFFQAMDAARFAYGIEAKPKGMEVEKVVEVYDTLPHPAYSLPTRPSHVYNVLWFWTP